MSTTQIAIGINQGTTAFTVLLKGKSINFEPMNNPNPKGGVMIPITAERITMIPKAIKS